MPYVSAHYAPPSILPMSPDAPKQVQATDNEGTVWALTEDSQVGDWLRYIAGGGTIDPAPDVPMAKVELPRDIYAELDALEARIAALEKTSDV